MFQLSPSVSQSLSQFWISAGRNVIKSTTLYTVLQCSTMFRDALLLAAHQCAVCNVKWNVQSALVATLLVAHCAVFRVFSVQEHCVFSAQVCSVFCMRCTDVQGHTLVLVAHQCNPFLATLHHTLLCIKTFALQICLCICICICICICVFLFVSESTGEWSALEHFALRPFRPTIHQTPIPEAQILHWSMCVYFCTSSISLFCCQQQKQVTNLSK